MSGLFIVIIVIAVLAFAAGFFFVRAYNKRLDRIASGQERDTHSSVPEPRTTVSAVYRIILLVVAAAAFLTVSAMSGKLSTLQSTVSELRSSQHSMSRELWDLRQQLEESGKRVASTELEMGAPDYAARTAELSYSLRLREYGEDTAVTLVTKGREVPLTQQSAGTFAGTFTAGFFEELGETFIRITEGGHTVTEAADLPEYVFWDFLPLPGMECSFSSGVSMGKLKYEGSYRILLDPEEVDSVTVTYLTGGKELKTLDITRETRAGETITLEKGLALEKDLTFRIEIVTKRGFRIVEQQVMIYDSSADFLDAEFLRILDQDGSILWEDPKY